ncbi:Arrestin domain-containing protein 2 [Aphelenchoides fujianensis]|nr:Arrestin domain-containing protein 2 [Aphelenchoides fujianensis]
MKIEHFDLVLIKDDDKPYVGGEEMKGHVEIVISQPVQISRLSLRIFGEVQTAWSEKRAEATYNSREFVLDEYMDLTSELYIHCNESMEFHAGKHLLEFKTRLPMDVVSSVERENMGAVRYTCMAILDVPEGGDSQIIAEREFKVVSFLNLDAPYLRESVGGSGEVQRYSYCFHKPRGQIKAEVQVAELGILPGETVRIQINFENTMKKKRLKKKNQKCALLSLCQQIDFRSQHTVNPGVFAQKSVTIAVHSQGTCKAAPGNGPETRYVEFDVPENLPSTSVSANGLVTCSYFFRLDMDHFDVIVPVVVGSVKSFGNEVFH